MRYLSELAINQTAEIKYFKENGDSSETGLKNRLYEMGFYPGNKIRIIKPLPMPIVCINESRFAISEKLFKKFMVK